MRVGVISGSGSYEWPLLADARPHTCRTPHGSVEVTLGRVAGVEVVHLARHGTGHMRLSNHITHKANIAALLHLGVECAVSLTVCGAVDPALAPGSLVAFDDLYFPSNRLPDGTLCTWHDQSGAVERGHWIFDAPISGDVRQTMVEAAAAVGVPLRESGCYGHVDGPRFNSRAEIAALAAAGVVAVSQTAGPEIVLAGEAALPLAVLGYVTDHANGVSAEPQPVAELLRLMRASTDVFARLLEAALPKLEKPAAPGLVYRIES